MLSVIVTSHFNNDIGRTAASLTLGLRPLDGLGLFAGAKVNMGFGQLDSGSGVVLPFCIADWRKNSLELRSTSAYAVSTEDSSADRFIEELRMRYNFCDSFDMYAVCLLNSEENTEGAAAGIGPDFTLGATSLALRYNYNFGTDYWTIDSRLKFSF